MRGCHAGLLLGFFTIAAANAADFSGGHGAGYGNYDVGGRMEPVIVYDFEPGVIVRSYWYAPWENRHYFPRSGRRPKVGRLEHMPARRISKPEEYYRYWSVSSVFNPLLAPANGLGVPSYSNQPR
jgi:hypothetical protein